MKNKILSDILKLEEGKGYRIVTFFYSKEKGSSSKSIMFDGDMNFFFIINDRLVDLLFHAVDILAMYKSEIEAEMDRVGEEEFPLLTIGVMADSGEITLCSNVTAFSATKADQNEVEKLIDEINDTNNELTKYMNSLLDAFVESTDDCDMNKGE